MKRLTAVFPETDKGRALLVGLAMLSVGLFFAWPPAALIVPGALLVILAILTPPEAAP